jgi:rhodanese-related sulfurtransferase
MICALIMRRWLLVLPFFVLGCEPAPKTVAEFEPPAVALPASVQELSPADAERFLAAHADARVIDARTEAERQQHGHMPRAEFFDYLHGQPSLDRLKAIEDKSKPCLIYCAIGGRAKLLAVEMIHMGFTEVKLLQGGFNAWVAAGKAVAR